MPKQTYEQWKAWRATPEGAFEARALAEQRSRIASTKFTRSPFWKPELAPCQMGVRYIFAQDTKTWRVVSLADERAADTYPIDWRQDDFPLNPGWREHLANGRHRDGPPWRPS